MSRQHRIAAVTAAVAAALAGVGLGVGGAAPAAARLADGYPTRPTNSAPNVPAWPLGPPELCAGQAPSLVDLTGRTVRGTDGDDIIIAAGTVYAGDGDDRICWSTEAYGQKGHDRIELGRMGRAGGGAGDDVLLSVVNEGAQESLALELHGGPGNDLILGLGTGWEQAYGGAGDDEVRMGRGPDVIALGAGDDTGLGGSGDDWIYGEAGDDTVRGEHGDDILFGGTGEDTGYGGEGEDRCSGLAEPRECENGESR
jgi:Ca2+-binding RTX toxin-like protein